MNGREKRNGRKQPILQVTWLFLSLFLGMIGYICYFSAANKQEMINNTYNGMQSILMEQNSRGTIYAAQGEILAETQTDEEGKEKRVYPYGNLFSHTVGYATQGKAGLESQANYYLIQSGVSLSEKANNAAAGLKNPGDSIYTTLQTELQEVASRSLGVYKGAVIATEPSTGKILAMVSKPDFDPAQIPVIWDQLLEDKESSVLLNRASQGIYPPGSTFKIITALEYVKENNMDFSKYSYRCSGSFVSEEERIQCYHGSAHGQVDFVTSFAKSCNSSFANLGLSLEKKAFAGTLEQLLFDQELPFPLHYKKSYVDVSEDITNGEMMQVTIGQGATQITPAHLNMITCAIANNGILMTPYLIDSVKTRDGNLVKQFSPSVYKRLIREEEAHVLQKLMEMVVEKGTATRLQNAVYTAAGKTGSAEFGLIKGESHAWFTGYAPAEDPQICVTIIIEGAGAGGDYAVPVAKRIFDAYLGS